MHAVPCWGVCVSYYGRFERNKHWGFFSLTIFRPYFLTYYHIPVKLRGLDTDYLVNYLNLLPSVFCARFLVKPAPQFSNISLLFSGKCYTKTRVTRNLLFPNFRTKPASPVPPETWIVTGIVNIIVAGPLVLISHQCLFLQIFEGASLDCYESP